MPEAMTDYDLNDPTETCETWENFIKELFGSEEAAMEAMLKIGQYFATTQPVDG